MARKRLLAGVLFGMSFFLVLPAEALRQRQEDPAGGSLPEGEGKELVLSVCAQCHALGVVTAKRMSRNEWETTVNDMIARGAVMAPEEVKAIAGYLGEHFSPDSRATAAAASESSQAGASYPDGPGKEVLLGKCFQCHGDGMWRDLRQDRRKWEGTLYRMVGKGALWSEEEINAMADYLAAVFGPQSSGSSQGRQQ